jgi:hypothetical protein
MALVGSSDGVSFKLGGAIEDCQLEWERATEQRWEEDSRKFKSSLREGARGLLGEGTTKA